VVGELVLGVVLERVELLSGDVGVSMELELVAGLLALVVSARPAVLLVVALDEIELVAPVVSVALVLLELGVVDELKVDGAVLLVLSAGVVKLGLL